MVRITEFKFGDVKSDASSILNTLSNYPVGFNMGMEGIGVPDDIFNQIKTLIKKNTSVSCTGLTKSQ